MRKTYIAILGVILLVPSLRGQSEVGNLSQLSFELPGTDGKTYTPKTLGYGKPFILVYIEEDEIAKVGLRDIRRLARLLSGKLRVVGLFGDKSAAASKFKKKYNLDFLLLCRGYSIAEDLGSNGTYLFTNAVVGPDGKVVKISPGYCRTSIQGMLKDVANLYDIKIKIDLKSFPKEMFRGTARYWGLPPPSPEGTNFASGGTGHPW